MNPSDWKVDRTDWPSGPWDDEPDRLEWRDEATGLPSLVVRNVTTGSLCGYVGVHTGHPLFALHYPQCVERCPPRYPPTKDQIRRAKKEAERDPHGFQRIFLMGDRIFRRSAKRYGYRRPMGDYQCRSGHDTPGGVLEVHGGITFSDSCFGPICHAREPGERRVWWFGFDASHAFDVMPGLLRFREPIATRITKSSPGGPYDLLLHDIYRDVTYVKSECASLARQLAAYRRRR